MRWTTLAVVWFLTLPVFGSQEMQNLALRADDSQVCKTELSKDFYGFGIRLGYYCNWAAAWIANNWVPDEIGGAQDQSSILLLALLISMVRTAILESLTRLDALILLELCVGTIWSCLTIWGYRTCLHTNKRKGQRLNGISYFGGFGTHFRLLLTLAVAVYAMWFFAVAAKPVNGKLRVADNPKLCETIHVLSKGLPLVHRGIRYPAIIFAALSILYCGMMCLASFAGAITKVKKYFRLSQSDERDKLYATSLRLRYIPGLSIHELQHAFTFLRIFNAAWLIFAIIFIEFTLNLNSLDAVIITANSNAGVWTPAQLIPMLIGIFSLLRMIYLALEHFRAPDGDIRPSLGTKPSHSAGGVRAMDEKLYAKVKWYLKCYSIALSQEYSEEKKDEMEDENETRIDEIRGRWSATRKLILTWLPWLSLFSFWPWQDGIEHRIIEGLPIAAHVSDSEVEDGGTSSKRLLADSGKKGQQK